MKEEGDDIELIDLFLEGKLSASEAGVVRKRIEEDKEFADLYQDLKYVIESTKVAGREDLLGYLKAAEPKDEQKSNNIVWYWISGVAATIAIVLSLFFFIGKGPSANPNEDLVASYFSPYPNVIVPVVRGEREDSTARAKAFRDYELGNYESALRELTNIDTSTPDDQFYMGVCALALKDYPAAVSHLKKYEGGESFATQTRWYLALAYLGTGNVDMSRKYLSELARMDNNYSAKASELMTKLK
ncbi:MAG TPA: hypothetical protein VK508_17960 [Cyclobacteriaceae bacterium]|nr:hypothetical protein [Cyclobacteriaceae bacterium]